MLSCGPCDPSLTPSWGTHGALPLFLIVMETGYVRPGSMTVGTLWATNAACGTRNDIAGVSRLAMAAYPWPFGCIVPFSSPCFVLESKSVLMNRSPVGAQYPWPRKGAFRPVTRCHMGPLGPAVPFASPTAAASASLSGAITCADAHSASSDLMPSSKPSENGTCGRPQRNPNAPVVGSG